jgi:23S rRNA (guanosine2251-2'-O)-methyltransferase
MPRTGAPGGASSDARREGGRRGIGGEQVEGRQAVRELLLAGRRRTKLVLLADDLHAAPVIDDIVELAGEARVPVKRVTRDAIERESRSEAPQGVLAKAAPLDAVDLDGLARPRGGQPPFLLAVDGLTDPQNLGALMRSAECAGVTGVVLPRHRAVHVTPSVAKAAAGAIEHLDVALVGGLPAALVRLRELGVWIVGLDEGGDTSVYDLTVADEPVAVVVGAEGSGMAPLTRERCDVLASIPLFGRLSSLNVAAAATVACFEVARRRRTSP